MLGGEEPKQNEGRRENTPAKGCAHPHGLSLRKTVSGRKFEKKGGIEARTPDDSNTLWLGGRNP